jgi:sterol desaturase/sphingolipid hydroxylase (fatty acid hydroxylase superfamily)
MTSSSNRKRVIAVLLCGLGVGLAVYFLATLELEGLAPRIRRVLISLAPMPLAMLLSHYYAARKGQRLISAGLMQDAVYFLVNLAWRVLVVSVFVKLLVLFYDKHLTFLTITNIEHWPMAARFVIGVLFADFLGWFHHIVRHKVKMLWYFHTIHHSQREMNYFSDLRAHAAEHLIANLITFIPLCAIQIDTPALLWWGIIVQWHTLVYHSNIRTNYGVLRYILVTPQSHRVHHSADPAHYDKNFGVIFSLWDHLFGTQWRNYNDYPETGVNELDFPMEHSRNPIQIAVTFFAQLIYPFRRIFLHNRVAQAERAKLSVEDHALGGENHQAEVSASAVAGAVADVAALSTLEHRHHQKADAA